MDSPDKKSIEAPVEPVVQTVKTGFKKSSRSTRLGLWVPTDVEPELEPAPVDPPTSDK